MITKSKNHKISKRENGSTRYQTLFIEPTLTEQQHKDDCDVNLIMAKYQKTGNISHLHGRTGTYMDLSNVPDFQAALDTFREAQAAFDTLPSQIRSRFGNDPQALIDYLNDPKNTEESIQLGLRVKKEPNLQTQTLNEIKTLNKNLSTSSSHSKKHKGNAPIPESSED